MREKTRNILFHNSEAKFSKRGYRYTFLCPLHFPHPGHHQLQWGVVSSHHLSFSHVYPTQHPEWGSKNTKHATPLLNTIHGSPLPSKQFSNFPTRLQNLLIMIRSLPTSSDSSLIIIIIPHFLPSVTEVQPIWAAHSPGFLCVLLLCPGDVYFPSPAPAQHCPGWVDGPPPLCCHHSCLSSHSPRPLGSQLFAVSISS